MLYEVEGSFLFPLKFPKENALAVGAKYLSAHLLDGRL